MEFGKVPRTQLSQIDFTLKKDSIHTNRVLRNAGKANTRKAYTGCAKWGRKEWVGMIYPEKTKEAEFLSFYVQQFNSLEFNATHYKFYPPETYLKWKATADGIDFKFCPKVPQSISHFSPLVSPKARLQLTDFIDAARKLGDKLGPVFLQLSERFSAARKENVYEWIRTLPRGVSFFIELRHPSWYEDKSLFKELLTLLEKHKVGLVITDTSGRRDMVHMELTTPTAFIRFVGNNLHPTDYTRVDEWAQRINNWMKKGLKEVYFFVHHTDEKNTPPLADYVTEQLNIHCKLDLKRPQFIKPVRKRPKKSAGK